MASSKHFYELDSLRGVAAVTVVFHHFRLMLGPQSAETLGKSPIEFVIPGHEAVMLFFVLSGFVLTLPYQRSVKPGYIVYLVKRICRIYLPYLAALALAICGAYWFHHPSIPANVWANGTWSHAPAGRNIAEHILFIGDYDWSTLNTAFWSLIHEMRISLIFPLIAMLVLRVRSYVAVLIAALLALGASSLGNLAVSLLHGSLTGAAASRNSDTIHYGGFFIAGSILAKNIGYVNGWYQDLSRRGRLVFATIGVTSYAGASVLNRVHGHFFQRSDEMAAVGAMILIVLALNSPGFKSFLQHSTVHYLGRISYSLYLVHGTVLFTLIGLFYGRVPFLLLLPLYLAVTLALAAVFHHYVEKPSMRLGRRFSEALSPPRPLALSAAEDRALKAI